MISQDHIKNCSYCRNTQSHKPTIKVKGASSYNKSKKLADLAAVVKGTSYSSISYPSVKVNSNYSKVKINTKGASNIFEDKSEKLMELGKLIKGSYEAA